LIEIHARDEHAIDRVARRVGTAFTIGDAAPARVPLVYEALRGRVP
jgi:hypothetical protein